MLFLEHTVPCKGQDVKNQYTGHEQRKMDIGKELVYRMDSIVITREEGGRLHE